MNRLLLNLHSSICTCSFRICVTRNISVITDILLALRFINILVRLYHNFLVLVVTAPRKVLIDRPWKVQLMLFSWTNLFLVVKHYPVIFGALKHLRTLIDDQGRSVPPPSINYLVVRDLSVQSAFGRECISILRDDINSDRDWWSVASQERVGSICHTPAIYRLLLPVQTNSHLILVGFNDPVKSRHPKFQRRLIIKIKHLILLLPSDLSIFIVHFQTKIPL